MKPLYIIATNHIFNHTFIQNANRMWSIPLAKTKTFVLFGMNSYYYNYSYIHTHIHTECKHDVEEITEEITEEHSREHRRVHSREHSR